MHRFPCSSKNISQDKIIIIEKEQLHHMKNVLRLSEDDEVIIFDEKGNEYICLIDKIADTKAILNIKNKLSSKKERGVRITVACAIPKKSKMDDIIDKLTQLGVERVIPLLTERVVVRLDKNKSSLRLARWRKIALNATLQSQRKSVVCIDPLKSMKDLLAESLDEFDLKLIPTLIGERKPLKELLTKTWPKNVLIFIGPEGDFTEEEVTLAMRAGCIPVSLGDLVLRVETAAVAITAYISLSFSSISSISSASSQNDREENNENKKI